jgi:hypothetical protein
VGWKLGSELGGIEGKAVGRIDGKGLAVGEIEGLRLELGLAVGTKLGEVLSDGDADGT